MKKFMIRMLTISLVAGLLTLGSFAAYTPPFEVLAESAYLVNLDNEMVIYEKNLHTPVAPGAIAQLMTVIVTLEKIPDPENHMTSMKGYIQDEMSRSYREFGGIRLAGLYRGEELSIEKLLYAVSLPNANEAAMMLADYVGDGSVAYFVEMMNQRAKELGAVNTVFTSPHGLPDTESKTTAYDAYLIAKYAMSLPGFAKLNERTSLDGGPTNLQPAGTLIWVAANRLLQSTSGYYNPAITGIKFSDSQKTSSSAISLAKRDGYSYLLVMLGCTGADENGNNAPTTAAFRETNRLLNWSFETFRMKVLLEKGRSFEEVPLRLCWGKDFLRLMSADNFTALIPDDIEISSVTYELILPSYVEAPIEKGDLVGEVRLVLAGEVLGRVGVVSAEKVEASRALLLLDRAIGITRTLWFKFIIVFLLVLIILYVVLAVVRNRNKRRYRGR